MRTALVYNFLIEANIMAAIAIILMIPIRRFLRRPLGNQAVCFGWLLVAIRLLLPISLPNPWIWTISTPMQPDPAIRPMAGQIQIRFRDLISDLSWQASSRFGDTAVTRQLNALNGTTDNGVLSGRLMILYVIGVMVVLLWFIISNVRFRLRLKADRIEPVSGELLEEYREICTRYGVRPVPVYFTDPLPAACLTGVFHPCIALPLTAKPKEAVQVLTHEVCHLKNRDHIWALVRLCCVALHWFNPLVWAAAYMSRTDMELACDDRVTVRMDEEERRAYAGILVLAASRRTSPGLLTLATGMTMTGKTLRTRIASVISGKKTVRLLSAAFVVLATVCLAGAFLTTDLYDRNQAYAFTGGRTDFIPSGMDEAVFSLDAEYLQHLVEDGEDLDTTVSGIFDSGFLKAGEVQGPFTAAKTDLKVTVSDRDGTPVLQFDPEGRLMYLNNPYTRWDEHGYIFSEYAIWDDTEADELNGYLQGFLNSFAPETGHIPEYYNMGERESGMSRFVDFAFRYLRDTGEDGFEEHVGIITLQLIPQTRIVHFEDQALTQEVQEAIGNG